jgi:hypothetical protein
VHRREVVVTATRSSIAPWLEVNTPPRQPTSVWSVVAMQEVEEVEGRREGRERETLCHPMEDGTSTGLREEESGVHQSVYTDADCVRFAHVHLFSSRNSTSRKHPSAGMPTSTTTYTHITW